MCISTRLSVGDASCRALTSLCPFIQHAWSGVFCHSSASLPSEAPCPTRNSTYRHAQSKEGQGYVKRQTRSDFDR